MLLAPVEHQPVTIDVLLDAAHLQVAVGTGHSLVLDEGTEEVFKGILTQERSQEIGVSLELIVVTGRHPSFSRREIVGCDEPLADREAFLYHVGKFFLGLGDMYAYYPGEPGSLRVD